MAKIISSYIDEANEYIDTADTKPVSKKYRYEAPNITPYRYDKLPTPQHNIDKRASYNDLFTLTNVPEYKVI
jgi:hypothetical protein